MEPSITQQEPSLKSEEASGPISFKVFTTTLSSLHKSSYHLATFNKQLSKPEDLPKTIREETYCEKNMVNGDDIGQINDINHLVQQQRKIENMPMEARQPEISKKKETILNRFVYEENNNGENQKFYGKDSTKFAGSIQSKSKSQIPPNDFNSSNYALMIFDKNKNGFRLVPIQRHIFFQKLKTQTALPQVKKPDTSLTGGVAPPRLPARKQKRQKAKDILNSFKSRINRQKMGFGCITQKPVETGAKRGRKKKMLGDDDEGAAKNKKKANDEDSALEYSDGNHEYDEAAIASDNSGEQNVEFQYADEVEIVDSNNNEASESVDDAKSKQSKHSKVSKQPLKNGKKDQNEANINQDQQIQEDGAQIDYDHADFQSDNLFDIDSESNDDSQDDGSEPFEGLGKRGRAGSEDSNGGSYQNKRPKY